MVRSAAVLLGLCLALAGCGFGGDPASQQANTTSVTDTVSKIQANKALPDSAKAQAAFQAEQAQKMQQQALQQPH